jgi:hypothetical protein
MADTSSGGSEERVAAWQQAQGGVVVADHDVRALVGLLAVLEGGVLLGQLDPDLSDRLAKRLDRDGISSEADLASAVSVLNQRLRTARGEYSV